MLGWRNVLEDHFNTHVNLVFGNFNFRALLRVRRSRNTELAEVVKNIW